MSKQRLECEYSLCNTEMGTAQGRWAGQTGWVGRSMPGQGGLGAMGSALSLALPCALLPHGL
jgi:hypothetical protein